MANQQGGGQKILLNVKEKKFANQHEANVC
jgi:hypothetical protein